MRNVFRLSTLTIALFASASVAQAAATGPIYGATFQGTASGKDTLGLFGTAGSSLSNVSFQETFLVDTRSGVGVTNNGTKYQETYTGWPSSSDNAGLIVGSLTINGKTVRVDSSLAGDAFVDFGNLTVAPKDNSADAFAGGYQVFDLSADSSFMPQKYGQTYFAVLQSQAQSYSSNSGLPTGLAQSFMATTGSNGVTASGDLSIYTYCGDLEEELTLKPTVSAAPEPGAWALMLGGIGILGAMMRVAKARRREDEFKRIATA